MYGDWLRDADASTTDAIGLMNHSVTRGDFQEGVQSFLDKRPPKFAPYSD